MKRSRTESALTVLLLLVCAVGEAGAQQRRLLYSKSPAPELRRITARIRSLDAAPVPAAELTRETDYFVRIAPRRVVLTPGGRLNPEAVLSTRPLSFLTTPQSVYGRTLLEIYEGIGYESEQIIRAQRDEEMVLILFRYPRRINVSRVEDGRLPAEWERYVYVPTWENVFSLFRQLALAEAPGAPVNGARPPLSLSDEERRLVLGFTEEDRERVRQTPYAALKLLAGLHVSPEEDAALRRAWQYRRLLETRLSLFEHFRGNGRTQNEVRDPEGQEPGWVEFVGPTLPLRDMPELSVIHLGTLTIEDDYTLSRKRGAGARRWPARVNSRRRAPSPRARRAGR